MGTKTILMVDDSESDHILTQHTIKSFDPDIELLPALGGKEALMLLETRSDVDVILLDINMPEMDGFDFLEAYTKNASDSCRVYLMLGAAMTAENTEKAAQYPCLTGFILKPINRDDLEGIFSGA